MSLRTNILRGGLASLLALAMAGVTLADTIKLKNGGTVKGRIVSFTGGKFVVAVGEGSRRKDLTFTAAEVESIKFDNPTAPPQLTVPANRTASYDAPAKPAPAARQPETPPAAQRKVLRTTDPETLSTARMVDPTPIQWTVNVTADNTANGWTNTGWVVRKGQRIRIIGDGTVSLGRGRTSTPSGVATIDDPQKLLKNVPTGALVAVIGDDNNDFIYIGSEREIIASRDGALFLGINEGNLDDNSGSFTVKVEVIPDSGQ